MVAISDSNASGSADSDLLVASIEEPNLGYLDPQREDAVNMVALISKQSFRTIDLFRLEKFEVVTCV